MTMKILHILNDGAGGLPEKIIESHSKDHQVEIIDLSQQTISYEALVHEIFTSDKVMSW